MMAREECGSTEAWEGTLSQTGNTTTSQMSQRELALRFLTRTRSELNQMRACLPDAQLPVEPLALAHLERMAGKICSSAEAFGFPEIAVIAGDSETGVTIMRVAAKLDSGAMFARRLQPIGPDETSDTLEETLSVSGAHLLVDVVDAIAAGTAREEPQDERLVTYAARLTKDEGLIDWTLPAQRIHDRVRGLYPWPHAYTFAGGRRVIVWRTRLLGYPASGPAGTVTHADRDGLHVSTGEGALALLELQSEGGRPLPAADFLRGHAIEPGARFGDP